ncbi:3-isopropylmalate dehydrogenase [Canibacter zhoujuaniae]|uniref:3-isopropylmalate dehydrogenase n=1 Tax=Canibacter zhoujuaniae TaxID=2708343 RepID=UPI00141ECE33
MREHKIALLPGDGIGPEVVSAALTVLDAAEKEFGFKTARQHYDIGATEYLNTGRLFHEFEDELRGYDAIFFGAMGDPRVAPGILERGIILEMRQRFDQAANVRPIRLYPGVPTPIADLNPERCELVIVRENTEGSYVAAGSSVHTGTKQETAMQESLNTYAGTRRVVEYAFKLANKRRKKLTLCHKTNVLVTAGKLWQRVVDEVAQEFPEVAVDYVHVDAMCFHLPLTPERFDVVVTDNLFGDIITDLGAVVQGGLGVATSANLNLDGSAPSMFEAIHGSAPDIAGQQLANPSAAILALALMLGHLGEGAAAAAIERATAAVIAKLPALAGKEMGLTTSEIGERIATKIADGSYAELELDNQLVQTLAEIRVGV